MFGVNALISPQRVGLFELSPYDYQIRVLGGGSGGEPLGAHFDEVFAARRREADEFYAGVIPASLGADGALVMRQALAGMLWGKQFYYFDLDRWLEERGAGPLRPGRKPAPRNDQWHHMYNADVISMPDKWEYPWYAAWDLAFHVLALTLVDGRSAATLRAVTH